jgi:hypothetical protein
MASTMNVFKIWDQSAIRNGILKGLEVHDQCNLRLASRPISQAVTPSIFSTITITFRTNTLIGHLIRHLIFNLPHSADTFLPPLIDRVTGEERSFHYRPQAYSSATPPSRHKEPKYGSWEMNDLLTQQYSPLFHASTNISAFIRALTAMPSMKHLTITSAGQESAFRYRRSTVDYALISLRIAVERSPLPRLRNLTLDPIHPGAIYYLKPTNSFGASPASTRRWQQIKNLTLGIDGWPFDAPTAPPDHLKFLHSYLAIFTPSLTSFAFTWHGPQGPCPLTLSTDPLLTNAVSSHPPETVLPTLHFSHLRHLNLTNAVMDSSQISTLIRSHRQSLHTADFSGVSLTSGDWDSALAHLTSNSGSSRWKERQSSTRPLTPTTPTPTAPSSPKILSTSPQSAVNGTHPATTLPEDDFWPTTMIKSIPEFLPLSSLPPPSSPNPSSLDVPILLSRGCCNHARHRPETPTAPRYPLALHPDQDFELFSPSGSTLTPGATSHRSNSLATLTDIEEMPPLTADSEHPPEALSSHCSISTCLQLTPMPMPPPLRVTKARVVNDKALPPAPSRPVMIIKEPRPELLRAAVYIPYERAASLQQQVEEDKQPVVQNALLRGLGVERKVVIASEKVERALERRGLWGRLNIERKEKWNGAGEAVKGFLRGHGGLRRFS